MAPTPVFKTVQIRWHQTLTLTFDLHLRKAAKLEDENPIRCAIMEQQTRHTRRFCSRINTPRDVYVYWSSADYDDTSRVRDLNSEGLFVQTRKPRAPGATTNVHFLVEEGPIRAEAIVRHVEPGRGFGLEFTAVREEDRRHLADLMKRLRGSSLISRFQTPEHNQQTPLQ